MEPLALFGGDAYATAPSPLHLVRPSNTAGHHPNQDGSQPEKVVSLTEGAEQDLEAIHDYQFAP